MNITLFIYLALAEVVRVATNCQQLIKTLGQTQRSIITPRRSPRKSHSPQFLTSCRARTRATRGTVTHKAAAALNPDL